MEGPPITAYAQDREGWEPWQVEYTHGVLLLQPPEPLRSEANRLRAAHDPRTHAICEAHVSLTVPFPRPVTEADWRVLRRAAGRIAPFAVEIGPLASFLPHPGVILDVRPFDALDHLRRTLEATPPFIGAAARRWPFRPHLTIAEFVTVERTRELLDELRGEAPAGSYRCEAVAYAVPDEEFRFEVRRSLPLGRPS